MEATFGNVKNVSINQVLSRSNTLLLEINDAFLQAVTSRAVYLLRDTLPVFVPKLHFWRVPGLTFCAGT